MPRRLDVPEIPDTRRMARDSDIGDDFLTQIRADLTQIRADFFVLLSSNVVRQ